MPEMSWGLGIILLELTPALSQGQEVFGYLARVTQYHLLALHWACRRKRGGGTIGKLRLLLAGGVYTSLRYKEFNP